MIKYTIPVDPKPKPRGRLAKGRICHSAVSGYRDWQNLTIAYLREVNFHLGELIAFKFYKASRGRNPDLDNLLGGILDAMVKGELIADDSISIIPWVLMKGYRVRANPKIEIYTFNRDEAYKIVDIFSN